MVPITLPDGRKIEGTQIDFSAVIENWNEYKLANGITLKMKLAVTEMFILDEKDPATGKPNIFIKHNVIMSTTMPP